MMAGIKRRDFIKGAVVGSTAALAVPSRSSPLGRRQEEKKFSGRMPLGLASYTFRAFDLDQTIFMANRVDLKRIVLKSMHLPLESPASFITAAAAKVRAAGLDLYGCGVVYMTTEAEVEQAFNYAGAAAMRLIVGVPNPELLGSVERRVKQTGIRVAIHNHGPEDKLYPTPSSAYEKIGGLDNRIGLCIDIGHTVRAGVDPAAAAERYFDRLLDVHIKDVSSADKDGQTVEIGRGVIDIPKFLQTLIKLNYADTLAFEYEKDEKDPLPGLSESVGYVRGVLAAI
jgi:inosose dehydratase